MDELTPEYQDIADEFYVQYGNSCCNCHNVAPCGYCIHPGNPANLAETPEAWARPVNIEIVDIRAEVAEHYINSPKSYRIDANPPRAVLWVLRVAIALAALAVASVPVAIYMSMPL